VPAEARAHGSHALPRHPAHSPQCGVGTEARALRVLPTHRSASNALYLTRGYLDPGIVQGREYPRLTQHTPSQHTPSHCILCPLLTVALRRVRCVCYTLLTEARALCVLHSPH